jgi:hypothetical protein
LSTAVLFVAGLILLVKVNMARGREAALAADGLTPPTTADTRS